VTRYAPQWIQAAAYPAGVDRRLLGALWPTVAVTGMAVTPASAMTVNIAPGQAAIPAANGTGSVLCSSDAVEQVTLGAAPASGQNRYDLVVAQSRGQDLDGGANNDWLFTAVAGSASASPSPPAVPAGAVAVAQVYVPGASVTVTAPNILDVRPRRLDQPWGASWGLIGYVRNSLTTGPLTTVETDIAGLSITWTPIPGRRYRTSVKVSASSSVLNDVAQIKITDAANTMLELRRVVMTTAGAYTVATWETMGTALGSALAVTTRKARVVRDAAGTGNITILGGPNNEITVEDIGPN
jgi:hypothetical protein